MAKTPKITGKKSPKIRITRSKSDKPGRKMYDNGDHDDYDDFESFVKDTPKKDVKRMQELAGINQEK